MPHCTNNFAWYLGKFIAGFTGMFFFYMVFLKEREYSCLCGARMREFIRHRGEKRSGRCECKEGMQIKIYACGCKKPMDIDNELRLAGCTRIQEWFLENDPAIVSETVLALGRGLPKNDNDISSLNCMYCVTLDNRKPKEAPNQPTESTTSMRRKRCGRHCLFRHCSGIVCADKLMKRRRNNQPRARLHVSQDIVSDYWKICKSTADVASETIADDDARTCDEILNSMTESIQTTHKHEGETAKEHCNALSVNFKFTRKETGTDVSPMDTKCAETETAPKLHVDEAKPKDVSFVHWNVCKMSAQGSKSSPRRVTESSILCDIRNDSPKVTAETIPDTQRNEILLDGKFIKDIDTDIQKCLSRAIKKYSQSDTSFSDVVINGNCMDSVLYRELRKNCTAMEKKWSAGYAKFGRGADTSNVKSRRELDINLKHSANRLRSTSRMQKRFLHREVDTESTYPTVRQRSATDQKKLAKCICENCICDPKVCNRNSPSWNSAKNDTLLELNPYFVQPPYRILATSLRSRKNTCSRDSVRSKKSTDSAYDHKFVLSCGPRYAKYKPSLVQCKDKPTLVIYKNKRSNGSRALEELRCENLTHSVYTSATSTEFSESSVDGNRVGCRCPSYESSCCTMTPNDRHRHSRCNKRIGRKSLLSSSSSLSSSKRHRHWTMSSRSPPYHRRKPISPSSCTNVQACRKRYSQNTKRTSTYPSSTSSSSSLMSLSTFKEDLEITNTDQTVYHTPSGDDRLFSEETGSIKESRKCPRGWRTPKFHEQAKKKPLCTDERHVTWDIEHAC